MGGGGCRSVWFHHTGYHKQDAYIMRTNNGACPRPHINVITIIHPIAHCAISNTFFSTFKLFQQSEISRDYKKKFKVLSTANDLSKQIHKSMAVHTTSERIQANQESQGQVYKNSTATLECNEGNTRGT